MKLKNPNGGQEVEIKDEIIKHIMEQIMLVSSNGTSYVSFFNTLESCDEGFYIISREWFEKNPASPKAFDTLKHEVLSLKQKLSMIAEICK